MMEQIKLRLILSYFVVLARWNIRDPFPNKRLQSIGLKISPIFMMEQIKVRLILGILFCWISQMEYTRSFSNKSLLGIGLKISLIFMMEQIKLRLILGSLFC